MRRNWILLTAAVGLVTADLFTSIAISMYCPSMMSSLADGQMPNLPQLPGMPSI